MGSHRLDGNDLAKHRWVVVFIEMGVGPLTPSELARRVSSVVADGLAQLALGSKGRRNRAAR